MNGHVIGFFIGVTILSSALAYALWCKFRVVRFRQSIFDVRDRLFVQMSDLDALGEPVYQKARDHLNAIAARSELFTSWAVLYALTRNCPRIVWPATEKPGVQEAIDQALEDSAMELVRFLLKDTLTGRSAACLFYIYDSTSKLVPDQAATWSRCAINSEYPERLAA